MKVPATALLILCAGCSSGERDPADQAAAAAAGAAVSAAESAGVAGQAPAAAPRAPDNRLRDSAETGPVIEIPTIADTAKRPPGS